MLELVDGADLSPGRGRRQRRGNAGLVALSAGSTLTTSAYSQTSTGTFATQIGAPGVGLIASGTASLGGALTVVPVANDQAPVENAEVVTATAPISGSFAQVSASVGTASATVAANAVVVDYTLTAPPPPLQIPIVLTPAAVVTEGTVVMEGIGPTFGQTPHQLQIQIQNPNAVPVPITWSTPFLIAPVSTVAGRRLDGRRAAAHDVVVLLPGFNIVQVTILTTADDLVEEPSETFTLVPTPGVPNVTVDDRRTTMSTLPPPPPSEIAGALAQGIGDWFDGVGGAEAEPQFDIAMDSGFDLGDVDWAALGLPQIDPPVDPDRPRCTLRPRGRVRRGGAADRRATADTLDDVVADLEAAGCPADFAVAGAGGAPEALAPDDIIQVRCSRTLGEILEASGYSGDDINGATPDVLEGLAASLNLDGDIAWRADGIVELVAGVDLEGFYVLGSSGAQLRVQGAGTATGSGTVAGVQNTSIDGNASADVTVGVRMDARSTSASGHRTSNCSAPEASCARSTATPRCR